MNSTSLLARFRLEVFDSAAPYLWSDAEVYSYIDATQKTFCRRVGGLLDSTSGVTQVAITAGNAWATISPLILKIQRMHRLSDFRPVDPITLEDLTKIGDEADYGSVRRFKLDNMQGEVRYAITNMEADRLRLLRIPAANDTLALTVYRMPLTSITGANQALEIAEQHHEHMLLGLKALAYLKQDAETRDDKKATTFDTLWRAYCEQARQERERREHKPRAVAYGGI